jgi:hypothetical protein
MQHIPYGSAAKLGKRLADSLARRLGYVVLPIWRRNIIVPPDEEHIFHAVRYLRRLFDLLRIDCVLDVGANLGQYRDFLRDKVGYTGLIVSFEPIPSHVQILKDRAQQSDPDWQIEDCALGANTPYGKPPAASELPRVFPWLAPTRTVDRFPATTPVEAHPRPSQKAPEQRPG